MLDKDLVHTILNLKPMMDIIGGFILLFTGTMFTIEIVAYLRGEPLMILDVPGHQTVEAITGDVVIRAAPVSDSSIPVRPKLFHVTPARHVALDEPTLP